MMGELDTKQLEYVQKILGGIDQMSELVEALLDIGRLESGVDLVPSRMRIEEVLASVAEEYRQPAQENGIELVIKISEDLPVVEGDVSLIRQAVTNYVSNAIKYSPNSGLVSIGARVDGSELVIFVKDRGPGLSDQDQIRVFEKFYRIENGKANKVRGTGLGLSLAKSIAERHGGQAWCESKLGIGSTFFLSLPLIQEEE
jgi:two-component system phosphate regulon sensor histidine kinase PhoR